MIKKRGTRQDIAHDLDMLLLKIDQLDQKIMRKNQGLCEKEVQTHQNKLHMLFSQLAELAQLVHQYTHAVPMTTAPLQHGSTIHALAKKKQKNRMALVGYTAQKKIVGK